MNSSIYNADRATHLRILATAIAASIVLIGFSLSARTGSFNAPPAVADGGAIHKTAISGKEAAATRATRG
jgi:hypothetical protein